MGDNEGYFPKPLWKCIQLREDVPENHPRVCLEYSVFLLSCLFICSSIFFYLVSSLDAQVMEHKWWSEENL